MAGYLKPIAIKASLRPSHASMDMLSFRVIKFAADEAPSEL